MTSPSKTLAQTANDCVERRYLSHGDFKDERTFRLPEREMTRDAIIRFARRYDPQPFHLDERAARASLLKGLSASGWHTCSVFMGALQEGFLQFCRDPRLFAVDDIKWLFPVRPGDRIGGVVRARATNAAGPWPGTGQVELDCAATTAEGRRVMVWKGRLAVPGFQEPHDISSVSATQPHSNDRRAGALGHFEDVAVGDEIDLGSIQLSSHAIREFIDEFKLATDDGGRTDVGSSEANGWHVTAVFMNKLIRYYLREAAGLRRRQLPVPELGPSPGIRRLQWHAPVRAGDTLSFRAWAERKAVIAPRSNWGLLVGGCAGLNQNNLPVVTFEAQLLLERRNQLVVW